MYLPDDYDDGLEPEPDPDPWMFDDDDVFDEGEPTLRMIAQTLGVEPKENEC